MILVLLGLLLVGCNNASVEKPGEDIPPTQEEVVDVDDNIKVSDRYLVYINLDGFARYYYDEAVKRKIVPNLEKYIDEGMLFDNLVNLTPSITNPMQAMIISGASSSQTHNVYRYYDIINKVVVQQQRQNDAENIYQAAIRNNISVASVLHFPAETDLSATDINRLYVKEPFGTVSNGEVRFDQAIKLVRGETFKNNTTDMKMDKVPQLLTIYCDDLDALGHNTDDYYGYKQANTEAKRVGNVLSALGKIDKKLGQLVDAYKAKGLFDKTVFLLTTDHGMTPFGANGDDLANTKQYAKTKWIDLKNKLSSINAKYTFEYLAAGKSPKASTTVVGVGSGLQMPLTFLDSSISQIELQNIASKLQAEYYIEKVLTKAELIQLGFWRQANVDLLVIPAEKYHFHGRDYPMTDYYVRGQHDTWLDSSRKIYGIAFGGSVKNIKNYNEETVVTAFGVMMADTLGIKLKNANAKFIDFLDKKEY